MVEEKIIETRDIRNANRFNKRKIEEIEELAREELLPLCHTCLRQATESGQVITDWRKFTKANLIKEYKVKDKKTHKIIGLMRDYECDNGHGISVELPLEEIKAFEENKQNPQPKVKEKVAKDTNVSFEEVKAGETKFEDFVSNEKDKPAKKK